jgi:signal transduction histidine kinase
MAIDNSRLYRESQKAVQLREEFLSVASHELRTPINALQLVVQGLTRGAASPTPEHVLRAFGLAKRQIARLTRLVEELLDVSRIEAGRFVFDLEWVDLGAIAQEVVQRFEAELPPSRSLLSLHAKQRVVGYWNGSRIEQVVTNLLSNAIKFGAGEPIQITVDEGRPGVGTLIVTDHGIGISQARVPHIFERFERAVSAREFGGLGLGLYIVRSIVEGLGGTVRVESAPGLGSTFTVELPCEGARGASSNTPQAPQAKGAA